MIIDSHVHFGNSPWGNFSHEDVLNIINESVDYAICSNLEGIESPDFQPEELCNKKMLDIANKNPKLKMLYVCQPNIYDNTQIARSFLEKHPEIIGLKFHPECMKLPADNDKYDKYLKLAEEFDKPCLYHSGHIKSRFSSPKLIYKKAQEFPNVKFILGHLSTGPRDSHIKAIEIILESIEKNNAKLFIDTSWIDFAYEELNESYEDTLMLIESLKNAPKGDFTNRILWATDCPVGKFNHTKLSYQKNLETFKEAVLKKFNDSTLLENLLHNNAKNLFKI